MIDWQSLQFARLWPLALLAAVVAALALSWFVRGRALFPDLRLLDSTRTRAVFDRGALLLGAALLICLTLVMTEPSVVRIDTVEKRARDFLLLVDTSRSMRHDSDVRRDSFELHFERRVGAFAEAVDDPGSIPFVARFELARESLLSFLEERRAEDRVGLIYFNDDTHPVAALTTDIAFVVDQLGMMDDYVNWGTDIATAIDSSLALLARYTDRNRRALVILTDAETRFTNELEQQLARLAREDLSFYLLWIKTEDAGASDEEVASFLNLARSVGVVVTIDNLDSDSLRDAFRDISRLEGYSYTETRRSVVDLSQPVLAASRVLLAVWLLLMATAFHPGRAIREFEGVPQ